ncbi:hypothetical protein [Sharpea azabuensis]|uniref:hypothetical protein n=1 Tax=Sharpea azabuensis TaxID=322505 RepID=UPI0015687BFD|nr:hypothetical protein [Sharpea azabuensis]
MSNILSHFTFDEAHVVVAAIIAVVVLFECKFGKPITFIFGKQKIYAWIVFVFVILCLLSSSL